MKHLKFLVAIFVIFSFTLILRVGSAHAQIIGFDSDCLEAVIDPNDGHTATITVPTAEKRATRGYKTPKGEGQDTWVFVCIATTNGNKCTTGDPQLDFDVFQKTADYDDIMKNPDYKTKNIGGVVGGVNPIAMVGGADPQFADAVSWHDEYIPAVTHAWIWVQAAEPVADGGTEAGGKGAQQQATFDFLHALADSSKCTQIGWDPKGYVIDSKTLYPVKGVAITISQKGIDGLYTDMPSKIGLTNPDTSLDRNGQYSFFTPPGTYKLRITSTNATLADVTTLNPSYKSVFSLTDPISTIYKVGQEIIEEAGKVAVSHIPVVITDESMLVKDLAVMWRKEEKSVSDEIFFSGALSHPKSLVKIVATYIDANGTSSQDTTTEITNEIGEYKFTLPQTKTIAQTKLSEEKTVYLIKYDVTFSLNPEIYSYPGIQSPQNSFSGEVIPAYIDGIAYDENNQPLADAVVGIYPSYSENAMSYAVTDKDGRYIIGSQHIPQFAYSLRYKKNTGEVIKVSTATFVKQNAAYFAANEIKPFSQRQTTLAEEKSAQTAFNRVTGNKTPDMTLPGGSKNKPGSKIGSRITSQQQDVTKANSSQGIAGMQGVVMVVVVLLVLIMIGGGAFVMMKSKQIPTQSK